MGGDEFVRDGGGAVVDRDLEAAGFDVEDEILAHDGQTNKSEIAVAHGVMELGGGGGVGYRLLASNPLLRFPDAFPTLPP
ncbi:hypothetical protein llg_17440 [Luteolibacter sp. LG18]|nr:hypothetical protein llg_17440 [Luteolibacter sp. LG18]